MPGFIHELGKEAKDKITGIKGVIVARIEYLFGCNQYGISPRAGKDGKRLDTEYFDEGRIEIIGKGVTPESVKAKKPGPDYNRDAPR
jgi:hypothetical protein